MDVRQEKRIRKIKRDYGTDAFERWGKRGGSPLLMPAKVREYYRTHKRVRK
jgi:hypothetical protein